MKGYVLFIPKEALKYKNAGYKNSRSVDSATGKFNACVPLKMLLGFAEDYRRVIVNIRQELVLVRSNSDKKALELEECTVSLTKLSNPGLQEDLTLTKCIGKNDCL